MTTYFLIRAVIKLFKWLKGAPDSHHDSGGNSNHDTSIDDVFDGLI